MSGSDLVVYARGLVYFSAPHILIDPELTLCRLSTSLLVGIDDYPPPVLKLRGCVNDIQEMRQYLQVCARSRREQA